MSQFTDIAIKNTTMEVAPVVAEVSQLPRKELCRLFAYFATEGITTYDQLAEEMKRWGIMIHEDPDFPGEFKLCHGSKTNHAAPMYPFSNGAVLEKVEAATEGEATRFRMRAYNFDIMKCNEAENTIPEEVSTAIHPEMVGVSPVNEGDLITQIPGVKLTIFRDTKGRERITTTRMLDAFKSVWNGRNFGEQARETFDLMYMRLFGRPFDWSLIHFNYTYTFLLVHPDNSKEIYHPVPEMFLIGIRNMATFKEDDVLLTDEHGFSVFIPGVRPLPHMKVSLTEDAIPINEDGSAGVIDTTLKVSYQTVVKGLNTPEVPRHVTGYILRVMDADGDYHYQVFNSPAYKRLSKLYGNPRSSLFQYFEMRRNKTLKGDSDNALAEFEGNFPHMIPLFKGYEANIQTIANEIYKIYCAMYIPECKPKNEAGETLSIHLPKFLRRTVDDLKKLYYELNREAIEKRLKTKKIPIRVEHVLGNLSKFDPPLLMDIYNKMIHAGSVPVTLQSLLETATVFDPSAPRGAGAGNA